MQTLLDFLLAPWIFLYLSWQILFFLLKLFWGLYGQTLKIFCVVLAIIVSIFLYNLSKQRSAAYKKEVFSQKQNLGRLYQKLENIYRQQPQNILLVKHLRDLACQLKYRNECLFFTQKLNEF